MQVKFESGQCSHVGCEVLRRDGSGYILAAPYGLGFENSARGHMQSRQRHP